MICPAGSQTKALPPELDARAARRGLVAHAVDRRDVAAVGDGVAALDRFPGLECCPWPYSSFSPGCQPMAVG